MSIAALILATCAFALAVSNRLQLVRIAEVAYDALHTLKPHLVAKREDVMRVRAATGKSLAACMVALRMSNGDVGRAVEELK